MQKKKKKKIPFGFFVLSQFEVSLSQMSKDPARATMLGRNIVQKFDGLSTVVPRQFVVRNTQLSHQVQKALDAMPLDD